MKLHLKAFIKVQAGHKEEAEKLFQSKEIDDLVIRASENWEECYSDEAQAREAAEWVIERYEAETNQILHVEMKDELMKLIEDHFTRTSYPKVK
jgi:hypothetical protein